MLKISVSGVEPQTFDMASQPTNSLLREIVILYNTNCITSPIMNRTSTFFTMMTMNDDETSSSVKKN